MIKSSRELYLSGQIRLPVCASNRCEVNSNRNGFIHLMDRINSVNNNEKNSKNENKTEMEKLTTESE